MTTVIIEIRETIEIAINFYYQIIDLQIIAIINIKVLIPNIDLDL
jgi:hypothetical protein